MTRDAWLVLAAETARAFGYGLGAVLVALAGVRALATTVFTHLPSNLLLIAAAASLSITVRVLSEQRHAYLAWIADARPGHLNLPGLNASPDHHPTDQPTKETRP